MSTQFYKIELTVEIEAVDKIKFRQVKEYLDKGEFYPYQPEWKHDWCNYRKTCEKDYFIKGM